MSFWIALIFGISFPVTASADVPADFARSASAIKYFGPRDFLYGFRDGRESTPANADAIKQFAEMLDGLDVSSGILSAWLKDRDPKIRTLAIAALYDKEDPTLLPLFMTLLDDKEQTFPALALTAGGIHGRPEQSWPLEQQTVGQFASAIINFYLNQSGYHYGPHGTGSEPGFDQYWNLRKNRPYCAGWFGVKLVRASHGTSPTPTGQIATIKKLRDLIDAIPEPDRTLTLLWLNGENGSEALVGEDELLGHARSLGPERLMRLLARNPTTDDPDLQPRNNNNHPYARACLFVLQHARDLLRPNDAVALLAQETWERDHLRHGIVDPLISPWWAIAAARLQPDRAPEILQAAYRRFTGAFDGGHRLSLAKARWELLGDSELPGILDWYFRELNERQLGTWSMSNFLMELAAVPGRDERILMKALIADPRFERLNWKSIEVSARIVNSFLSSPVIGEQELSSTKFPSGVDFFYRDELEEMKRYPKETKAMLEILARWRKILREKIPDF